MAKRYDVFLSFSRGDGLEYARELSHRLQMHGFTVFMDAELLVGEYRPEIDHAIEGARAAVLLLSESASKSKWVEREVVTAIRRNTHVVPVLLDHTATNNPVFSIVSDRHYIDATGMSPREVADRITPILFEIGAPIERLMARTRNLRRLLLAIVLLCMVVTSFVLWPDSPEPKPLVPDSRAQILRLAASLRESGGGEAKAIDGIVLPDVDLSILNFSGARIRRAVLVGTDLSGSDLSAADLSGSSLTSASLREAIAPEAKFSFAKMALTDCSSADFTNADFTNADLRLARLDGAILRKAKLQNADLSTANIENTVFDDAEFNRHTLFPDGFDPVAARLVRVGDGE